MSSPGTTCATFAAGMVSDRDKGGSMADDPGGRDDPEAGPAESDESGSEGGVLTRVCLTCGKEYFFSEYEPPAGMLCERCGGSIFRSFFTAGGGDEAARDFEDSTARDLDPDDAEGDALPGDVIDLDSQ